MSLSLTTLFHLCLNFKKRCLFAFAVMLIIYMCRAVSIVVMLDIIIMFFLFSGMDKLVGCIILETGMYSVMFFEKKPVFYM